MRSLMKHVLLLGNQAAAAGPAPFSDDFNRADGALGNGWIGATWAIASGAAVNTPTTGSELITNGTFDTDISGWTDISTGTASIAWINDGQPAGALLLNGSSGNSARAEQEITTIAGTFYRLSRYQGGTINTYAGTSSKGTQLLNTQIGGGTFSDVFRAQSAETYIQHQISANLYVDNSSVKALSDLIAFQPLSTGDAYAETALTYTTTGLFTHGGIAHYVDADNYVVAYHESRGNRLRLAKKVGGTWTELANVAATYSAGAKVRLTRSGTSYAAAYGGSTLINATAVADAVFTTADKWGLFATAANCTFADFAWAAA